MIEGKEAEYMFYRALERDCKNVRWATRNEDMYDHFDVVGDGIKYDVKTQKKLNRWDEETSDIIWIEFQNVRGNAGWLYGKADKIAFLQGDKFLIVDRDKLAKYCFLSMKGTTLYAEKGYKTYYRRKGQQDLLTYIYPSDIAHLIEKEINI